MKKLLKMLLAGTMVMGLTACGSNDDGGAVVNEDDSELVKAANELAELSKKIKGHPNKELIDLTRKIKDLIEKYK